MPDTLEEAVQALQAPSLRSENQFDFSGGANPSRHPLLLAENEVSTLTNAFPRIGGGIDARGGFKLYTPTGTNQGTTIFEMEQSTGTILTHVEVGNSWYDETMWPRYRLFNQTPGVNDAAYFGAREPFFQLILYLVYAFVPGSATQGLVFEYWNGSAWTDFTSAVVGGVADDKKLAATTPPREAVLTWGTLAGWTPNQVETRGYQYWIRIRVTVDLQNGGSDVVVSQRRVRGDWLGRRHMLTADIDHLWEWPGLTVTRQVVVTFPTGQRIPRVNQASLNDHLYYALDGQKTLQRWNGSRGTTRLGGSNNPSDAGLTAPSAAPVLTQPTANPNAYPAGYVLRYRLAFEHGPESILGESRPSGSTEITLAGANNVRVGFAAAVTQAATLPVSAILIYATYRLDTPAVIGSERDFMGRFLLVKRVTRDDADWNAGFWEDTFVPRIQQSPIAYDNSPPLRPKYVTEGGKRLWIANETTVAASDIGRGDSWDPTLQFPFPGGIRGILYHNDQLLVFHGSDISYIKGNLLAIPDVQYFWRGIGLAQSDTLCVHENEVHFVSQYGPARIIANRVEFTGKGRVWEDGTYWDGSAPIRRLAPGAAFNGRVWFGVDRTGSGPGLSRTATLDLRETERGAWSDHDFSQISGWGTFGVIHAPLDHALARQLILCAFPDGSETSDYHKLAILEYGTTDTWTSAEDDGVQITSVVQTRSLSFGAADRWKQLIFGHIRQRLQKKSGGTASVTALFISAHGRSPSKTLSKGGSTTPIDQDFLFSPTAQTGGGKHRDTTPALFIVASSEKGWTMASWIVRGWVEGQKIE